MKKTLSFLVLVVLLALLAGVVFLRRSTLRSDPAPEPVVVSAVPTQNATPEPTPEHTPEPSPEPTPEPTPEPAPKPTPEPTPEPAPEPTPAPANYPRVTKDPGGETVKANGACQFVTRYENALWAEWHFVSPDGARDLDYREMKDAFPQLIISNGFTKDMTLSNIPVELHGWRVYCRFTNEYGSTDTKTATITIQGQETKTAG